MFLASKFENMITHFMVSVINSLLQFVLQIIQSFLINPVNMNALPGFSILLQWIQYISTAALVFVMVKELFINQLEDVGDNAVSPLVIVKNTLIATFLIWVSPLLIKLVLIPITIDLAHVINNTIGSPTALGVSQSFALSAAGTSAFITAIVGSDTIGVWAVIIVTLIILVIFAITGIQAGLRWAELFFLALVGPILAVTKASFGTSWNLWLRETTSVVLSQLVQYFAMVFALYTITHPNIFDRAGGANVTVDPMIKLFAIIGILVFAVTGPRTLRSILAAGNPSGLRAVGTMAKTAATGGKGIVS